VKCARKGALKCEPPKGNYRHGPYGAHVAPMDPVKVFEAWEPTANVRMTMTGHGEACYSK